MVARVPGVLSSVAGSLPAPLKAVIRSSGTGASAEEAELSSVWKGIGKRLQFNSSLWEHLVFVKEGHSYYGP